MRSEVTERVRVIRAVLDTNIFLRALIRKGNISHKIFQLWQQGKFLLITSEDILNEISEVLKRSSLLEKFGYDKNRVDQLIDLIRRKAIFVKPEFSLKLCRDEHDDKFIDCAILGRAKFLVSEDKDIIDDLNLKKQLFEYGIETNSALDFYEISMKSLTET